MTVESFITLTPGDLYYKSFMIIIYDRNNVASTKKTNYNLKALASFVNYGCKRDATIWSMNLASSFTIVKCL